MAEVNVKSFSNVLVVAGEPSLTHAAVESAVRLVAPAGGMVSLLVVGPRSPRTRAGATVTKRSGASLRRLYDPGPQLQQMGVPVHHEFAAGPPLSAVLDRIDRHGHDLVIVGDRSDARFASRSLASRLLRSTPLPVWVQGETADHHGPVAVAVGPSDEQDPGDRLARKLIDAASSLATARQRPLHVIHAWRLAGETLMRGSRLSYQATDIERMGRDEFAQAHFRIERLIAESSTATTSSRILVLKGHATDVILDAVAKVDPALLVMGTMSRRGIPGMIVGNTIERVAGRTDVPLLAIQPDAFGSRSTQIEDWSAHALPY